MRTRPSASPSEFDGRRGTILGANAEDDAMRDHRSTGAGATRSEIVRPPDEPSPLRRLNDAERSSPGCERCGTRWTRSGSAPMISSTNFAAATIGSIELMAMLPTDDRPRYVVDASVVVKWHLRDERDGDAADYVLDQFREGRTRLVAPVHIRDEVSSAIRWPSAWDEKRPRVEG